VTKQLQSVERQARSLARQGMMSCTEWYDVMDEAGSASLRN